MTRLALKFRVPSAQNLWQARMDVQLSTTRSLGQSGTFYEWLAPCSTNRIAS